MALENGDGMVMPVTPMYGNGGWGNGFGGDGWWVILFLFALMGNWGGGFGGFGGFGNEAMFPYFFNTQTQNDVNRGFDNQHLGNQITSVQDSVNDVRTDSRLSAIENSINNGFASMEVANCNRAMSAMQTDYQNQISDLERSFNAQTAVTGAINGVQSALAKCCCDNQLQTESLRATVLQENCQDRYEAQANARDIIANQTAGFQRILDQLCNDKIDAKNEKIVELQNQLNMANFRESQTQQNALFAQGMNAEVDALYNRLSNCPVPSVPVYGRQPIFTCGNNSCCCGGNGLYNGIA